MLCDVSICIGEAKLAQVCETLIHTILSLTLYLFFTYTLLALPICTSYMWNLMIYLVEIFPINHNSPNFTHLDIIQYYRHRKLIILTSTLPLTVTITLTITLTLTSHSSFTLTPYMNNIGVLQGLWFEDDEGSSIGRA
jgi:hypothetical protein